MGSKDKTFILSESGHIAGIINPPSKGKYGHYTNDGPVAGTPEDWLAGATKHPGSWWPRWGAWLAERSGPMVKARVPQDVLAPAPGTYVTATPEIA
jgi:polyhydroxyalkanoate synthase